MSLESIGTHGKISVSCETSYGTNIKSFTADTVVSSHNKTHLECEQQLMRTLFEAYLNSDKFKNDVHELNSNITVKFERKVELVMPS